MASWFGTKRNPLSGRNNYNDAGEKRLGDILFEHAVVEVKRRSGISMSMALETKRLAQQNKRPWVHYEFRTGLADVVKISTDFATAAAISGFLKTLWVPSALLPKPKVSAQVLVRKSKLQNKSRATVPGMLAKDR